MKTKMLFFALLSFMVSAVYAVSPNRDKVINSKLKTMEDLVSYAQEYLHRPYAEMAKGPESFDGPGFISYIYSEWGYDLPYSSKKLMNIGKKIKKAKKLEEGDIVFFNYESRIITGIVYKIKSDDTFDFIYVSKEYGVTIGSSSQDPFSDIFLQGTRITTDKELKQIRKEYEKEQKAIAKSKKEAEKEEKAQKKAKEKQEKEKQKAEKELKKAQKEAEKSNKRLQEASEKYK